MTCFSERSQRRVVTREFGLDNVLPSTWNASGGDRGRHCPLPLYTESTQDWAHIPGRQALRPRTAGGSERPVPGPACPESHGLKEALQPPACWPLLGDMRRHARTPHKTPPSANCSSLTARPGRPSGGDACQLCHASQGLQNRTAPAPPANLLPLSSLLTLSNHTPSGPRRDGAGPAPGPLPGQCALLERSPF